MAPSGMMADSLATAASVVGPDEALKLVQKFEGVELLMVREDGAGTRRTVESAGFEQFLIRSSEVK
jgi:thiamine biosynthesis lipoprotein ApbE